MEIENYNELSFEELKKLKAKIINEINSYNSKISKLEILYNKIDLLAYNKCNHNWIKDTSCSPYERPEIYCDKCLSYKK